MKSALYLILFCCTFTESMTHLLSAAEADSQPSASRSISTGPGITTLLPVQSFLETTHYFEIFEMGYKQPWQKRLLQNKTEEQREALQSLIDALAKDIVSDKAFRDSVYSVYLKHFTAAELKTLNEFYKSDVGAKIIRSQLNHAPMTPSASDQHILNVFGKTPLGNSLNQRMAEINTEVQLLTAPIVEKHQMEYFPKFRQLDR